MNQRRWGRNQGNNSGSQGAPRKQHGASGPQKTWFEGQWNSVWFGTSWLGFNAFHRHWHGVKSQPWEWWRVKRRGNLWGRRAETEPREQAGCATWNPSNQCAWGALSGRWQSQPREVQGRGKLEKRRANACLRKMKTKIWPLGLLIRNPLVTSAKQASVRHAGRAWPGRGARLGCYKSPGSHRINPVSSNVKNAWSASIHVSAFFLFHSAFLEIPIRIPFSPFTYIE